MSIHDQLAQQWEGGRTKTLRCAEAIIDEVYSNRLYSTLTQDIQFFIHLL